MSVTVETVDEEDDEDDSLAAASVSINAVDVVQNCENDTSISLDIPCESGGVFSFDDPNFNVTRIQFLSQICMTNHHTRITLLLPTLL